ncbi:MAG: hypothetical protein R3F54_17750 [Alphaproteobacteria bacterium]
MGAFYLRKATPLVLAALLFLGGCDDEEEKPPEVTVNVPKGTVVRVEHTDPNKDEMIVFGELALFVVVIAWALFGPGATGRRGETVSENR